MKNRQLIDYLLLFLKGAAMGAADVVPGVSGGTIAFISGIYEELLSSIRAVNLGALRTLFTRGPAAFWYQINGNFLFTLLSGLAVSYVTLAHFISRALSDYPILLWSFFFGLIVASIVYIFRQLPALGWRELLMLLMGTLIALVFFMLPPLVLNNGLPTVFAAAALAICAMILPGVSGSFILLLLGMYSTIIDAVVEWDLKILGIFLFGCICGLMSFTRFLTWVLAKYYSLTIATLTGFLMGSLVIVWPWKEAIEVMMDSKGREIVLSSKMLMPWEYASYTGTDPLLLPSIGLMVFGFVLLLGLEYFGARSRHK